MNTHDIELLLLFLGFGLGISTRLQFAFRLTIFMLQVIEWWIKTHPTGQKMAAETNLDDEFYRLFGVELQKHSHLFNGHQEEPKPRLLKIGEAAKIAGVGTWTLREWDKNGKLKPFSTTAHGDRLYRQEDVEKLRPQRRVAKLHT